VHAYYAKTRDFSAGFRQHYTYVAIGRTEDSEGTVQVKKPGRVRWDYAKPDRARSSSKARRSGSGAPTIRRRR